MITNEKTAGMKDRKAILSTLWTFVIFNYNYADIAMMNFDPAAYQKLAARMSEGLVLGLAVLMEIAIVMVLLSRVLRYRANRWANIIAGVQATAFVAWSLIGGIPPPYYMLYATSEIACTLFIIWYAWTWPNPESQAHSLALDQGELRGHS